VVLSAGRQDVLLRRPAFPPILAGATGGKAGLCALSFCRREGWVSERDSHCLRPHSHKVAEPEGFPGGQAILLGPWAPPRQGLRGTQGLPMPQLSGSSAMQ
jgi:hypothetical protein